MKKSYRIRMSDKVMVISGKDQGKVGKVLRIFRKKDAVIVEKANMVKRHQKGNPQAGTTSQILEKEMPIHISNVMLVCSACQHPTRVGYKYVESNGKRKKVRFCKKCNEVIE